MTETCSFPGCLMPIGIRGLCKAHHAQRLQGNGLRPLKQQRGVALPWVEKVALPYDEAACLDWPFGRNSQGYGQVWVEGKNWRAHRYVMARTGRLDDSPGMEVRHLCGNRSCVNLRHLANGTAVENAADKVRHGTAPWGERCGGSKLTAAEVIAIRGDQRAQREIAAEFGVSQPSVSRIKSGEAWAWLALHAEDAT